MHQVETGELVQNLNFDGIDYDFHWALSRIDDSTTQVNIGIKDRENSLKNKVNILVNDTDFEKKVKPTISDFIMVLNTHLENFEVKIEGESTSPSTYCAYIPVTTKQFLKAKGMMENYGILSTFLIANGVVLNGKPIVEVRSWDTETDSISYNFCYPIVKKEGLPSHPTLRYKEIKGGKAIKAIYNGNYITSDRAWYALIDYAKKKNIQLKHTPIEVFNNNPNMGGNELTWKAEIYMPIKNKTP
ncbi:GyrI-like domain-containing protein [Subsaximicrobium wynnwilliamsii]|uniref:GyrI-like domain-containing protein n=2 Tax=Subsaximicrobium wynnwilliamsii TaxID=291179 RepID=A0A5C6ZGC1_9FLAO|nr:GyrI-like domain-containing protein [Subsaximicrobium wynnwilliamsii]TXD88257.1 GyrI-like domain-containing protein [Subsaximicrobium wynnwilliamsii]